MTQKVIPYIYIAFLIFVSHGIFAQKYELKITSKTPSEIGVLNAINHKKNHTKKTTVITEIDRIADLLKKQGYFTLTHTTEQSNLTFTTTFDLGPKTTTASLQIDSSAKRFFKKDTLTIPVEKLETLLINTQTSLEQTGETFSVLKLEKTTIQDNVLYGVLTLDQKPKRTIDKMIVKGYDDFPKKYLDNYFNIDQHKTFNSDALDRISSLSKNLSFVEESRKPETLFTKDSTTLYLYLKKKRASFFDGMLNFVTDENSNKLSLRGRLDLQLINALNSGEQFLLFWNKISDDRSELNLSIDLPFVFNTKLNLSNSLKLYRQDSTFINTHINSTLSYNFHPSLKVGLTYENIASNSQTTNTTINPNLKSNFIGAFFKYKQVTNHLLYNEKWSVAIHTLLGNRSLTSQNQNTKQTKFFGELTFSQSINKKSYLHIKNATNLLFSKSYFINELFRIGGIKNLRGFNEQSIFTKKHSYFTIEYRYLINTKSTLYPFFDFGVFENLNTYNQLFSLGLGYSTQIQNNTIDLGYAIGKQSNIKLDLDQSKIYLRLLTFF